MSTATDHPTPIHGGDGALTAAPPPGILAQRLQRVADAAASSGADAVLVGPGADLRYLIGHSVASHERLTCLAVTPDGRARLLVPALERPGWAATPAEDLGIDIVTWLDGQDPHATMAALLPDRARVLAVDNELPARHLLGMQAAVPGSEMRAAGGVLADLRMRKDTFEVAALAAVAAAVDRVQDGIGQWLLPGRTEVEVAADIAAALVDQGHAAADFVIVGSGPNGASPHHDAGDRLLTEGDAVVIDIGGPSPAGYFSDCTRTYTVGPAADDEFAAVYDVVRRAQAAGVAAAVAGARCAAVDAASRAVISQAGYGEYFITRTGHGIGLEVHEDPYMVDGNDTPLEPGMAFSVEPGIYLPGRFGVRIEDIVVIGADGRPQVLNTCPMDNVERGGMR